MENCATIGQDYSSIKSEFTDDITYWAMETTSFAKGTSITFRLICENSTWGNDK